MTPDHIARTNWAIVVLVLQIFYEGRYVCNAGILSDYPSLCQHYRNTNTILLQPL